MQKAGGGRGVPEGGGQSSVSDILGYRCLLDVQGEMCRPFG